MRKIISLVCLTALSSILAFSQDIEDNAVVRNYLDSVFENLDKSKVPTGYLRDYAFEYVDLSYYDGTELTDSNYVNSEVLEMILKTVRSAALSQKPFGNTTDMLYDLFRNTEMIPVPIALYKYNNIKETAIEDGLIRYENEKVYDVYTEAGSWKNPYETKYAFGFAPMANESYLPSVLFDFSAIYTNVGICDIDFDAGDGAGYRRIYKNDVIRVNYIHNGEYELKLRIILYDGVTLETHSTMNVNVPNLRVPFGDDALGIDTSDPIEHNGLKAYYRIKYKSTGGGLTKPIIIAEGFDPVMPGDTTDFGKSDFDYKHIPASILRNYDFVYVDFLNSEMDIFDNADLLKKIIREINNIKHQNGSEEKNIIVGQSLGGVISRIALREMEIEGEAHETKAYVSHDSPHLGANVPIGLLYAVNDLLSFYRRKIQRYESLLERMDNIGDYIKYIKYASDLLESPAVKQILVNYVTPYGVIDNSYHQNFLNQLNSLGFPQGDIGYPITNIAITKSGNLDLNFTCDKIFSLNENIATGFDAYLLYQILGFQKIKLLRGIGSNCNINAAIDVFPYKNSGCKVSDLEFTYNKRMFGTDKSLIIESKERYAPSSGIRYDGIPSSLFEIPGDFDDLFDKFNSLEMTEYISFIPTVSALCMNYGLDLSTSDYNRDFYINTLSYPSQTPFEYTKIRYGQGIHEFGYSTIYDDYTWIINIISQLSMSIEGPDAPMNGDIYAMKACDYPVSWSTSDNDIASIDENGVILIHSNGFVNVNAHVNIDSNVKTYSKRVLVGFPNYTLTTSNSFGVNIVTASTSTELADFIESTNIKYHWGVLYSGTENTVWTEVRPSGSIPPLGGGNMVESFNVDFAGHSNSRMALVTFYVSNSAGESERYTTTVINKDYVSDELLPVPPPIIIVNSEGEILDTSSGEVVNVSTKSADTESYYLQIESDDIEIEFNSYPSESEIISALVLNEGFHDILRYIKPWGSEEIIIKTISLYDNEDCLIWSVPLTIMYSDEY